MFFSYNSVLYKCTFYLLPFSLALTNSFVVDAVCVSTGKIVKSADSEGCQKCENNEGVCHLKADDDALVYETEELCQCPVSRTGNFCQVVRGLSVL